MTDSMMSEPPAPHSGGWNIFVADADRMRVKKAISQAQTYYRAVTYISAVRWLNLETRLHLFLYLPISRRVDVLEKKVTNLSQRLAKSRNQASMANNDDVFAEIPSFAVERCVVWQASLFRRQESKDFLTCLIDCGTKVSVFPREHLGLLKNSMSATAYEYTRETQPREFFVIDVASRQKDPVTVAWWGDGRNIARASPNESADYADIFDALWDKGLRLENDEMVRNIETHLTGLIRSWEYG